MTQLIPSEDELHAYVDDRLAPQRRAEVAVWLAANPQQAAQIEAWRADARRLRVALAGFNELSYNPALELGNVRRRLRDRRYRRLGAAAVLLLAIGVGGAGGWQAREMSWQSGDLPMADALQAHKLFADATALDIEVADAPQLQSWLGRHFNRVGQLPDLSGYGLRPLGARLLANEQGPAALLVFQDAQGERISLFLRSPGQRFERMPEGQRVEGQLEARYWSQGAYNFALVSAAADQRAEPLRRALGLSL